MLHGKMKMSLASCFLLYELYTFNHTLNGRIHHLRPLWTFKAFGVTIFVSCGYIPLFILFMHEIYMLIVCNLELGQFFIHTEADKLVLL